MMGFMPPYFVAEYPMYPPNPYMLEPYKWKPKKNKIWVKKDNE